MLKLFLTNNPIVLFALAVIIPALLLFNAGGAAAPVEGPHMPFFAWLELLVGANFWASISILALLVALCSVRINMLSNRLGLFDQKSHLPALFFALLACSALAQQMLNPILCGLPFVLYAIQRSWGNVGEEGAIARHFDSGLLLGLACMFYLPYILLLPAFWVGMAFMRTYRWREWTFIALGIGLVFLFVRVGYFLFGMEMPFAEFGSEWQLGNVLQQLTWPAWLFWGFTALLTLWAFYWILDSFQHSKMQRKNILKAMGGVAFFFLLVLFLSGFHLEPFRGMLLTLPLAVLFSFLFSGLYTKKAWLANSVFYVWLALLLFSLWVERTQMFIG